MIDFTYQYSDSFLHRLDPAVKLFGLIFLSAIVLLTNGLFGTILSAILIAVLMFAGNLSFRTLFKPLKRLIPFLALIFLMNALFYSEESCLYAFWLICISKAGIIKGYNIVLHTFTITVLSSIFIRTTTSVEIMKGMETIMKPLRCLGVPVRDVSLIMSIALQFIPVFFNDLDRIRKAQISRGADFSGGSLIDRAKAVFPLVIPAFISAFRRADDLSMAIEARGFQSERESSNPE